MTASQQAPEAPLAPMATITIPPAITNAAQALAMEQVHPAWGKLRQRGKHFIVQTNSLDDISEIADWAQVALKEPAAPLSKAERQAYQNLLLRAERWAVVEPLGPIHCQASCWKHKRR